MDPLLNTLHTQDSIRISIIDIIIRHLKTERGISHYLLGFDFTRPITSQDFTNSTSQSGCLKVTEILLSREEMYTQHARLAERLLALLTSLCSDERVSVAVMTFLRQRDFFSKQLQRYAEHRENEYLSSEVSYYLKQKAHVIKVINPRHHIVTS